MNYSSLLEEARRIAFEASDKILTIYQRDFEVTDKADQSPLTEADLASHNHIEHALNQLTPDIPVLSEESAHLPFEERAKWDTYWLVDPLDGTKEFVKRNDEFTVNIALIHHHNPVIGVVVVPPTGVCYSAAEGLGAFKHIRGDTPQAIRSRDLASTPVVTGSRSHSGDMDSFLEKLGNHEYRVMGSSLKMCLVAEGEADIYPRLWLTSEWDTAAAHCVINEAGGAITQTDMSPLQYNTKDSLLNPYFFAMGSNPPNWSDYL